MLPNADGSKLYAGVGSSSNIAENGMEAEEGRAAIYKIDLASGGSPIFAPGLRNAVGITRKPVTSALWTVVNERDGLGDETPPDYATSVRDGGGLWRAVLLLEAHGGRPNASGRGGCPGAPVSPARTEPGGDA